MDNESNHERAAKAYEAMKTYAEHYKPMADPDLDPEAFIIDLMADLLHLAVRYNLNTQRVYNACWMHFIHEQQTQDQSTIQ